MRIGRKRPTLPPNNYQADANVQRRLDNYAIRAAQRSRTAINVDAHQARVWLPVRGPGMTTCPCSTKGSQNSLTDMSIAHPAFEGTGYAGDDGTRALAQDSSFEPFDVPEQDDFMRLLLGNGKRCGICWGSSTLNGWRLLGGERIICCGVDSLGASIVQGDLAYDKDQSTPTFVGSGKIIWHVQTPEYQELVAIRICEGLTSVVDYNGIALGFCLTANGEYQDAATFFSANVNCNDFYMRLTLAENIAVSFVDIIVSNSSLFALQLPQFTAAANSELIAPFISSDFEVDPSLSMLERGTLFEVPFLQSKIGNVWVVTDLTIKRTASNQTFGVTGQCRNVQPTEILAACSLDSNAWIGTISAALPFNNLQAAPVASGLPVGNSEQAVSEVRRGIASKPNQVKAISLNNGLPDPKLSIDIG